MSFCLLHCTCAPRVLTSSKGTTNYNGRDLFRLTFFPLSPCEVAYLPCYHLCLCFASLVVSPSLKPDGVGNGNGIVNESWYLILMNHADDSYCDGNTTVNSFITQSLRVVGSNWKLPLFSSLSISVFVSVFSPHSWTP